VKLEESGGDGGMVQKSGVTVQDILQLDCMRQTKVVAGHQGLSRIVSNVNVMEVPDIGNWVSSGDLLLTTAYSIRNDPDALARLIPELADKGLAGLALKPKRYLQNIPPCMIEQADQMSFPLLELPLEASFSKIINNILNEILQFQTLFLKRSEEAHRLFMEVILKGGHIEDTATLLGKLIDNTIIIYDPNWKMIAKHLVAWNESEMNAAAVKIDKQATEIVDPLKSGIKYYKRELLEEIPLHRFHTPIIGGSRTCGYLCVWDNQHPLTHSDFIFLDQAMTIFALELLNDRSLMEIERRYHNEFLDDLLNEARGDYNLKGLSERARYLGWDLTQNYVAFVLDIDNFRKFAALVKQNEQTIQETKEKLFYHIVSGLYPEEQFIAGSKSDSIILLLNQPHGLEGKPLKNYFSQRAEELLNSCQQKFTEFTVSLGVGRFYPGITGLRKSYVEALKALSIGKNLFGNSQVFHFDSLGIFRLLQQISDLDELNSFYQETIMPLDQHDLQRNSGLIKTLTVYFECNGNLKQVSKELYTHYNTILYRMERIEEITGLNMKVSEHRLNLQIGLKIRYILKEKEML